MKIIKILKAIFLLDEFFPTVAVLSSDSLALLPCCSSAVADPAILVSLRGNLDEAKSKLALKLMESILKNVLK